MDVDATAYPIRFVSFLSRIYLVRSSPNSSCTLVIFQPCAVVLHSGTPLR